MLKKKERLRRILSNALDEMKWHLGVRVWEGVQERLPRLGGALAGLGWCEMIV